MADIISDEVELSDKYDSSQSIKRPGLYVIKHTKPIALLLEAGNIKNPNNKQIIESSEFVNAIVGSIVCIFYGR